jgi:hypothetical protein
MYSRSDSDSSAMTMPRNCSRASGCDRSQSRTSRSHNAVELVTDKTVIVRQRDLLYELALSLSGIRELAASHPAVRATRWKPPEFLDKWLLI